LVVKVEMRNLIQGSFSLLCWRWICNQVLGCVKMTSDVRWRFDLRHVRGGSAQWFTDLLQREPMMVL